MQLFASPLESLGLPFSLGLIFSSCFTRVWVHPHPQTLSLVEHWQSCEQSRACIWAPPSHLHTTYLANATLPTHLPPSCSSDTFDFDMIPTYLPSKCYLTHPPTYLHMYHLTPTTNHQAALLILLHDTFFSHLANIGLVFCCKFTMIFCFGPLICRIQHICFVFGKDCYTIRHKLRAPLPKALDFMM